MRGFTKVDNELLQKLLTSDLTKRQLKMLLLIIRFSFGYQKSYAILRKSDYAFARVSPYCIESELEKLEKRRVIKRDPGEDTVWINMSLHEWAVEKPGDNPVERLRRFFKIATKNSTKQQIAIYQNSNLYREINIKKIKNKEELLLKVIKDYFLKVAPLSEAEIFILSQVVEGYPLRAIESAINTTSTGNDRSLSVFLKVLDNLTADMRRGKPGSLKESLKDFWNGKASP